MNEYTLEKAKKHFNDLNVRYLIGMIITLGIQLGIIQYLTHFVDYEKMNNDVFVCLEMLPFMLIGYPIFILIVTRKPRTVELEQHKMSIPQILAAFAISYAILYVSNLVGTLITTTIGTIIGQPVGNVVLNLISEISLWAQILIIVILAPIFEEIIFRKLIIDRAAVYGEKVAILLSATMFALYHGNIGQAVYAFALGAFFGCIYLRTGNIKYTIILHMMVNFVGSVLSGLLLSKLDLMEIVELSTAGDSVALMNYVLNHPTSIMIYGIYVMVLLALVITGIALFAINFKKFKPVSGENDIPKGQVFKNVFCNIGMLLITLIMVGFMIWQIWPK